SLKVLAGLDRLGQLVMGRASDRAWLSIVVAPAWRRRSWSFVGGYDLQDEKPRRLAWNGSITAAAIRCWQSTHPSGLTKGDRRQLHHAERTGLWLPFKCAAPYSIEVTLRE